MPRCMKLRHQLPFNINTYQVMSGHNLCSLCKHCASDYPFTSVARPWLSLTRFSFWWYLLHQVTLLCEKTWWIFIFSLLHSVFTWALFICYWHCSDVSDIPEETYPLLGNCEILILVLSLSISPYTSTCMHKNLHPNSLMQFLDTLLSPYVKCFLRMLWGLIDLHQRISDFQGYLLVHLLVNNFKMLKLTLSFSLVILSSGFRGSTED